MAKSSKKDSGSFRIGDVSGSNLAGVGPGARGRVSIRSTPDVERELAQLRMLIQQHAGQVDTHTALQAVDELGSEMRSGARPKKVRNLLETISRSAAGVTAVTAAVSAVKGLLGVG